MSARNPLQRLAGAEGKFRQLSRTCEWFLGALSGRSDQSLDLEPELIGGRDRSPAPANDPANDPFLYVVVASFRSRQARRIVGLLYLAKLKIYK
jgi:hypothetical protein